MTIDLEQIERLKASAVEQKIGPKRLPGTAGRWAERLREAAWKVGLHGTVTLTLPSYQALNLADKIDMAEDRFQVKRDLEETVEGAKEMLRDEYMRYAQATCDLELLLMNFIGRPPMSMDEVREQQRQFDAREPKPFVRQGKKPLVSPELQRSIMQRRIGTPREPGEEG